MTRPTAHEVAKLIRLHYARRDHGAGGCMHVQLDDGNLEDRFFDDKSRAYVGAYDGCTPECAALFDLLKAMKQTGRRKAVTLAHYGETP